jgi:hypothetical protein
MFDYIPMIITTNLMAVLFYASFALETSPLYKDKLKALLGTIAISLLGIPIIIFHIVTKGKVK